MVKRLSRGLSRLKTALEWLKQQKLLAAALAVSGIYIVLGAFAPGIAIKYAICILVIFILFSISTLLYNVNNVPQLARLPGFIKAIYELGAALLFTGLVVLATALVMYSGVFLIPKLIPFLAKISGTSTFSTETYLTVIGQLLDAGLSMIIASMGAFTAVAPVIIKQ